MRLTINNDNDIVIKQDFLTSAINDISGNIKFLDTKISLMMAVIGVLLNVLIIYRDDIYLALHTSENICFLYGLLIFTIILYTTFTVLSFIFGIITIITRSVSLNFQSIWYTGSKINDYDFNTYKSIINKLNNRNIIDNLSLELYKLNKINAQKSKHIKTSMICFICSCLSIFTLIVIVNIYNY